MRVSSQELTELTVRFRSDATRGPGSLVVAEATDDGVLIHPAVTVPVEVYSPQRKAEFLLSKAVDVEDYDWAVTEVRRMGLDPEEVPHRKPE